MQFDRDPSSQFHNKLFVNYTIIRQLIKKKKEKKIFFFVSLSVRFVSFVYYSFN